MAFPTTPILDNFNRANTGPPPSANWSYPIVSGWFGLGVISNQLATTPSGSPGSAYWNVNTFGPDCEVYATITDVASERAGLMWRLNNLNSGAETGYQLIVQGNQLRLFVLNGSEIADFPGYGTLTAGDKVGVSMVGNLITIYYAPVGTGIWGVVGTQTDATNTGAGYIGARSVDNSNDPFEDDFGGGTIGGVATPSFNISLIKFP